MITKEKIFDSKGREYKIEFISSSANDFYILYLKKANGKYRMLFGKSTEDEVLNIVEGGDPIFYTKARTYIFIAIVIICVIGLTIFSLTK
jgi:hypothetical protein